MRHKINIVASVIILAIFLLLFSSCRTGEESQGGTFVDSQSAYGNNIEIHDFRVSREGDEVTADYEVVVKQELSELMNRYFSDAQQADNNPTLYPWVSLNTNEGERILSGSSLLIPLGDNGNKYRGSAVFQIPEQARIVSFVFNSIEVGIYTDQFREEIPFKSIDLNTGLRVDIPFGRLQITNGNNEFAEGSLQFDFKPSIRGIHLEDIDNDLVDLNGNVYSGAKLTNIGDSVQNPLFYYYDIDTSGDFTLILNSYLFNIEENITINADR